MKNFIVYDRQGEILRTGTCPESMVHLQGGRDEFVMEGMADDTTQKIEFDGFDVDGQPINPRVVDKTPLEIEANKPKLTKIPKGKQMVMMTKDQWQSVLDRLKKLEDDRPSMASTTQAN